MAFFRDEIPRYYQVISGNIRLSCIPSTITASSITVTTVAITAITATATGVTISTTTTAAKTISTTSVTSTGLFVTSFTMRNFNFDFLTVESLAIEVFNCDFGVTLIGHGNEGVTFACVEDVVDSTTFAEFVFEEVARTGTTHAIDEKFNSVAAAHVDIFCIDVLILVTGQTILTNF